MVVFAWSILAYTMGVLRSPDRPRKLLLVNFIYVNITILLTTSVIRLYYILLTRCSNGF